MKKLIFRQTVFQYNILHRSMHNVCCWAVVSSWLSGTRKSSGSALALIGKVGRPWRGYRGIRQTSRQKNTTTKGSRTACSGRKGGKLLLKPMIGPIVNAP